MNTMNVSFSFLLPLFFGMIPNLPAVCSESKYTFGTFGGRFFFLIRDTDIGNLLMLKLAKCIPALLCLFPNFLIRIMIHYNHLPQRIFLFCHKSVLFSHVCYFVSACFFFKVHVHVHLQCTLAERFVSVFEILWTLSTWLKITASKDIKNNFLQTLNE